MRDPKRSAVKQAAITLCGKRLKSGKVQVSKLWDNESGMPAQYGGVIVIHDIVQSGYHKCRVWYRVEFDWDDSVNVHGDFSFDNVEVGFDDVKA